MSRPARVLHCTSEPRVFVGRRAELELLGRALAGPGVRGRSAPDAEKASVVVFVGPGGQGKTAIVQHWLHESRLDVDGLFFWSFYRGKDVDLCLRHWLAYAEGLDAPPEVSAAWCVDRLLDVLRRERWAVVLDGAEVVQHEEGPWRGRFVHPDLGRLLEELASEGAPGVVVVTTRFEVPTLARRRFAKVVSLSRLDRDSARALLVQLGVVGDPAQLDRVADAAGRHAKAVELAATYLVRFHGGRAEAIDLGGEGEGARGARVRAFRAGSAGASPSRRRGGQRRPGPVGIPAGAAGGAAGRPCAGNGLPRAADGGAAARLPGQRRGPRPAAHDLAARLPPVRGARPRLARRRR
jgi:hypothetical protein